MNFVLRTAHAEEKKKWGHTNPDVRTIIYNNERSEAWYRVTAAADADIA